MSPTTATARRATGRRLLPGLLLGLLALLVVTACGGEPSGSPPPSGPAKATPSQSPSASPSGSQSGSARATGTPGRTTRFRIASFNVLGASHTVPDGTHPHRPTGARRMVWATQVVLANHIDLVGFQEFEKPQLQTFRRKTEGTWGVFPGLSLGLKPVGNSVAWRRDTWRLLGGRLLTVPYFSGRPMTMPYVHLRNVKTGRDIYLLNVHNPATTPKWGDNRHWRARALDKEMRLIRRLSHKAPVFFTGDFNEVRPAFCAATAGGVLHSAAGAARAGCHPPRILGVDQIFGSAGVTFSGFVKRDTSLVRRASDHPIVFADVAVASGVTG